MNQTEALLVASFLRDLGNYYRKEECDLLYLPKNEEIKKIILTAEKISPESPRFADDRLNFVTFNSVMVDYLKNKIMKEHSILEKDLVKG